jgi:hypothetical protein
LRNWRFSHHRRLSKASREQVRICGNDQCETETRRRMGWIGNVVSVYDDLSASKT